MGQTLAITRAVASSRVTVTTANDDIKEAMNSIKYNLEPEKKYVERIPEDGFDESRDPIPMVVPKTQAKIAMFMAQANVNVGDQETADFLMKFLEGKESKVKPGDYDINGKFVEMFSQKLFFHITHFRKSTSPYRGQCDIPIAGTPLAIPFGSASRELYISNVFMWNASPNPRVGDWKMKIYITGPIRSLDLYPADEIC